MLGEWMGHPIVLLLREKVKAQKFCENNTIEKGLLSANTSLSNPLKDF